MSENVSEIFSSELDYSQKVLNTSTPIYRTVSPQNSTTITLSSVANLGPYTFIVPSSVFNFAKSRLNFTLSLPSAGTGNYTKVSNVALAPISRITCYDASTSALLFDCNNFQEYNAVTNLPGTDFTSFCTKAALYDVTAGTPIEDNQKSNAFTSYTPSGVNLSARTPTTAPLTFLSSASTATAITLNYSVPLSAIKCSIFSLDKLLYSPSNICIDIYWAPLNSYVTAGTDASDPSVGATGYSPATGSATISNLNMSLCNEANLAICSSLISRVMSQGLVLGSVGYVTVLKQAISSSTSHNFQQQLTKGFGSKIKAICAAPFSTVGLQNNLAHEKLTLSSFQTLINNVPLLSPTPFVNNESYTIANRQAMDGSAIQDISIYNGNWFNMDQFLGRRPLYIYDREQTMIGGLDISSQSSTWQLQATYSSAVAKNWLCCILGSKVFSFSNQGVIVA